jgi:uncharacterized lipoprotein YddW (UPF0748 family)
MSRSRIIAILVLLCTLGVLSLSASAGSNGSAYLPLLRKSVPPPQPATEFRGLWVTRYSWTNYGVPASPAKIDEIVQNAAYAGFNAILFQVRGTADAYYAPGLEPWAQRVSGNVLGQPPNPYWDPLQYFVEKAHARGMQLHAYINVYPVWDCGSEPPPTTPTHFYQLLINQYGRAVDGRPNGLQWAKDGSICNGSYQRATPASFFVDDHLMAVAADLVTRYDIDGIHLDHIRYGGSNTSCDPISEGRAGGDCFQVIPPDSTSYAAWQRAQVNGTVHSFYDTLVGSSGVADKPNFLLSAAVWPYYDSGYAYYYQDSKAWLAGGYIDAIMPMLYGSFDPIDNPNLQKWTELAAGFQADRAGRYVIPGMHGYFYDFSEIADRIEAARALGAAGHAIFAYNYLLDRGYFDDLAAGPYAEPAVPPPIPWHP